MSELTGTTKRVLDYLDRAKEAGESPTIRDIQDELSISSTSVVSYHLSKLEWAGYISRTRKARSIRLLKGPAGEVVMVFRGDDAELVRERLGDKPAEHLLAILATARLREKAG